MWRKLLVAAVTVMLGATLAIAPVVAQDEEEGGSDDSPTVDVDVDVPMDELVAVIEELIASFEEFSKGGGLENLLKDVLIALFYEPFEALANMLTYVLTRVITSYPDMTMADVIDLHYEVFQLALLLSVPAFIMAGYVFMFGSLFWIDEEQVKQLIPRLFMALSFGAVAPWVLQYPVRLSELVTLALRPTDPGFWVVTQLISETLIVAVLNALLLLGVTIMFIIRDVYLLFAAVVAPLLALGWALPYARQYASPLIGAFWGFLIIGPLDMIIFRLTLALLEVDAFEFPHFLWGLGGLVLMLAVPFIVLSAGASITGVALAVTWRAAGKTHRMVAPHVSEKINPIIRERYNTWRENRTGLRNYGRRAKNRFLDDSVDVRLEENSPNEVEMYRRQSLRNAVNRVVNRFEDDDPVEVEVEGDEWWRDEAELKEDDD